MKPCPRITRSPCGCLHPAHGPARDMGGEVVNAVAIQVSAGAVIVLGRSWVITSSEDLGGAKRAPASRAFVIARKTRSDVSFMTGANVSS